MDFLQSETAVNLARAFAGESQAHCRYRIFAVCARQEGHEGIARLFEDTAQNELEHAGQYYGLLNLLGDHAPLNLRIDAGFPFPLGSTADNLGYAAAGEREEHGSVYPFFARIARDEGFPQAADRFELIAAAEQTHDTRFVRMRRHLTDGTLYHSDTPIVWRCAGCGHVHLARDPWQFCPVCGRDRGWAVKAAQ